ncbi:putative low-complexity protein [Leptolyngbya sp. PCC 7375]|nr:putative low-complexity protein [Leptolyngbya sp. PCC 7375]
MKATEVLRLYKAGKRDFKGVNLRGQNFKGKDLSGADFSGSDIRSTNFTNANLNRSNFTKAKAGLQKRWAIGLVVILFLLSLCAGFLCAFSGYFVGQIFIPRGLENQVVGWISLSAIVVALFLLLRKGVVAVAVAVAVAVVVVVVATITVAVAVAVPVVSSRVLAGSIAIAGAVVGAGILVVAVAGSVAGSVVVAAAGVVAGSGAAVGVLVVAVAAAITVAITVAAAVAAALAGAGIVAGAGAGVVAIVVAVTVVVAVTLVSAYVGWCALKGDERDAGIWSVAIAFAAIGGTSFRGAKLTDANFSQACLKSTDLRGAVLLRTRWRQAIKLDRVRPGETYLNTPKVRDLVLTGNGQGQSYDYLLNLAGINLQGANLVKADFTGSNLKDGTLQGAKLANASLNGANLTGAYLQDADLSNTKLVQTQLDEADLTGTKLTGACIEGWNITTRTKLHGIRCDYVFMRLLSGRRSDQKRCRKPDDWNKTFANGEFVDFIAPMVETLDLYHNQTVDPCAVAIAFSDLRQQTPNADLEIISMEKRGQNLDKFNIRVRTSPQADLSQLHQQYFSQYEHLLTLPPDALVALLMEKEETSQILAGLVETAITQPKTQVNKNNPGDTTVSE